MTAVHVHIIDSFTHNFVEIVTPNYSGLFLQILCFPTTNFYFQRLFHAPQEIVEAPTACIGAEGF
jgi:hypothetical protein